MIKIVLLGIVGELGSGKTLALTYLAWRNYSKGMKIYSNYKLNFPYTPIQTPDDIINMKDGFASLDELWLYADSRLSASKKNKFVTMVLAKSRKRSINIGFTTQSFGQVDKRIRTVTDFVCLPKLNNSETVCKLAVYSNPSMSLMRTFRFKTQAIFNMYDTEEEISELIF